MGYWSYKVDEFEWEHFYLGESFVCNVKDFKRKGFDFIFHEDGGNWGEYRGSDIPVVYMVIDSTLSDAHYRVRLKQAEQADLVLLDHDKKDRFTPSGIKVLPWPYCVNDAVFKPYAKEIDVVFHCGAGGGKGNPGGEERVKIRRYLDKVCKDRGWTYKSGAKGLLEYAENMGKAKVVVNWPRTPINRPHRVFDTMACGAALLTGPLPDVDRDNRIYGVHYIQFRDEGELPDKLAELLAGEEWLGIAQAGFRLIREKHTWAVRARELYRGGAGHIPSAFSILELVVSLYNVMGVTDHFILSKGHGALALYAILEERAEVPAFDLEYFANFGGILGSHPSHSIPGVTVSTGSLGHGLGIGVGIAVAKQALSRSGRVFVLMGDGECMEGSVWEAVEFMRRESLNVVAIIDANKTHDSRLSSKFEGFGLPVWEIDGHKLGIIEKVLSRVKGPVVIIANTVKGKGCKTFERDPGAWHNRAPTLDELTGILFELQGYSLPYETL
jgi:transketolase